MNGYYDGLNTKLLAAIPPAARVLELGCANGRLGQRYKELHPKAQWWGVDISEDAVSAASEHLDRAFRLNLDTDDLSPLGGGFDVVVIGDLLEHVQQPEKLLERLYDLTDSAAHLVCCLPNMAHSSVLERMLSGDLMYEDAGLLDRTHLRFYSPASAFKNFLDGGWIPNLADHYAAGHANTGFVSRLVDAAQALGVPRETAARNLGLYQMIIECEKWSLDALSNMSGSVPFSVVVPVTRPLQLDLNILRSPGLAEVGAEVIRVEGARDASHAYAVGRDRARHDWVVMAHQDVYFPRGSGLAISQWLGGLSARGCTGGPAGFVGLEGTSDAQARPKQVGSIVDRVHRLSGAASENAVSLDEFAVALHRDSQVSIDPRLGWHLWATDLCLQAADSHSRATAQVANIPLFHNSWTPHELPEAFMASAEALLRKYPLRQRIDTLCGALTRPERPTTASLKVPALMV